MEIKKEEFEQLTSVLFHRYASRNLHIPGPRVLAGPTASTRRRYQKLLHNGSPSSNSPYMWGFQAVYMTAIKNLQSKLTLVEKIAIGELYSLDFDSWLLPAMQELVRRQEPISLEEGVQLGLDMALKLASVREQISYQVTQQVVNQSGSNSRSRNSWGSSPMAEYTVSPIVGSRAHVQKLDFSRVLRKTFKTATLPESHD
ncbi:hypothetical protein JVU11DRAFT_157 [Chiua virens]|nr:hypothetical protein JVU11DRAFT_157 [Chiua virens]